MCGLNYQLQKTTVKNIVEFLLRNHSTYVRQFVALKEEIEQGVKEARSNIEYLRVLVKPSAELNQCTELASIQQHLMRIMHLFRTIWLNSPYYNSYERVENLFKALSNQIIILCRNFIDLTELFQGKTRRSIEKFKECIDICESYKLLYDKVIF